MTAIAQPLAYATNPSYIRRALLATGEFEVVKIKIATNDVFVKRAGGKLEHYGTVAEVIAGWVVARKAKYGKDAAKLYEMAGI